MKKLVSLALVLALVASPAVAQEMYRGPMLHLGVGGALPISDDLSYLHGSGPSFTVGLGVPVAPRLDVTVELGYTRLSFDDEVITGLLRGVLPPRVGAVDFDISGGAHHFLSGTAGLRWTFATPGRAAFYLSGGTGVYYSSIGDPDVEVRDADGNLVGEGDGTVRGGEDTSYGFRLGAGVRLPVVQGVRLFVEPRYAWVLEDTQYLSARVGLSFSGLFDASGAAARPGGYEQEEAYEPDRYELSVGHHGAFFGNGDQSGWAYRASVSRRFFSDRTGLTLGLAYRRAIDEEIHPSLTWSKRQGIAVDLVFYVDALRFTTGAATHRLRVGIGPTLRHQWGEWPLSLLFSSPEHPVDVEHLLQVNDSDRAYERQIEGRTYVLFTDIYETTDWGGVLKLQYDLIFDRLVVGPAVGFWRYGDGNVIGYGLHVGWRL